ncbi:MAG: 1-deoxy-D-xylulose-5-phosphate reductoisomerase [Desulfuromonas sp.]|nr:MAG: 1-deoxy-D-xylulose-5-phosphate reductoisomerase [Desulfuromonas sp.]
MSPRKISVLGSTGSIGVSTLDVVRSHSDRFQIVAMSGGSNLSLLEEQVRLFRPDRVAVISEELARELSQRIGRDLDVTILHGVEGMIACATHPDVETVVSAIVGAAGLVPTMAAIEAGKSIALANKETLVVAGSLVMEAARRNDVSIYPVDSEHSAIEQSLCGHRKNDIRRLLLTASGGPFRTFDADRLKRVTPEQALAHPNWEMGAKITIDSATMMNKGLEVIEARWLFDLPQDQIEVVIHPESIVHSMVEYVDGSIIAQMGVPDMRTPIAYALSSPERLSLDLPPLDLCQLGKLTFEAPDPERFPCLGLAYRALQLGGTAPAVLNAANEIAVASFLEGGIPFVGIPQLVRAVLERHQVGRLEHVDDALKADLWARSAAREMLNDFCFEESQ